MKKLKVFSISAILIAICCSFYFQLQYPQHQKNVTNLTTNPAETFITMMKRTYCKGLVTIRGKKYYFNEKGIQQNGWQKIRRRYYFFQIRNGCYAPW